MSLFTNHYCIEWDQPCLKLSDVLTKQQKTHFDTPTDPFIETFRYKNILIEFEPNQSRDVFAPLRNIADIANA